MAAIDTNFVDEVVETPNKTRKVEENETQAIDLNKDQHSGIIDLSGFVINRILSDNGQRKTICADGTFTGKDGKAVILLEKTPFNEEVFRSLCTKNSALEKQFLNDIYGSYACYPEIKLNGIKATVIFPATEEHIKKYELQPFHLIEETREYYDTITLPYLNKEQFDLQWVYNILEHEAKGDRIVFEDEDPATGFVPDLLPDLKWDGKQVENLYLLALVRPYDIKSLRDRTGKHLPPLINIKEKATWVYNILEHKAEVDRIVFEDEDPETGFVLLPDLKWDGKQVENLYLLALVRPHGIKSLRDLTGKHLPLLINIKEKATKAIEEKYKLKKSQLRVYIHYRPSFYHLHVHFTYLRFEAPGIYAERSHMLSTVITNLQLRPDYYHEAVLPFMVKETENLFVCYEEKGIVEKVPLREKQKDDGIESSN